MHQKGTALQWGHVDTALFYVVLELQVNQSSRLDRSCFFFAARGIRAALGVQSQAMVRGFIQAGNSLAGELRGT